jgi:hypothetical protein
VHCVVRAHPSWVTKGDFDDFENVPVMILAPEKDMQFSDEIKRQAVQRLIRHLLEE